MSGSAEIGEFAARFHQVVDELDRSLRHDNETMWLLGSLAARLVGEARADNWTDLKLKIAPASLAEVVTTLDAQAGLHAAEGRDKPAYVARLLGISLVAGRIEDPLLRQRDTMLNNFIDTAATVFSRAAGKAV